MLDYKDDRDDRFDSDDTDLEDLDLEFDLDLDLDLELTLINDPSCQEIRLQEFENLVTDIITWIQADQMATGPGNEKRKKGLWT